MTLSGKLGQVASFLTKLVCLGMAIGIIAVVVALVILVGNWRHFRRLQAGKARLPGETEALRATVSRDSGSNDRLLKDMPAS